MANNRSLRLSFPSYELELEVKFLTDRKTMERILEDIERSAPFIPEPVLRDERTNTYYDTKSFRLYKMGYECRGRKLKDSKVFRYDLKTTDPLDKGNTVPDEHGIFSRREYRQEFPASVPELKKFNKGELKDKLKPILDKKLLPTVKGTFTRKRFKFSPTGYPDCHIEAAFEEGYFESPDGTQRSAPLFIIEMELKAGRKEALEATSRMLADKYGLQPCTQTKGELGLAFVRHTIKPSRKQHLEEALSSRVIGKLPDLKP